MVGMACLVKSKRAYFGIVDTGLVLSTATCISPAQAVLFGLSGLVERMSGELIAKITELQVDSFELACLRGIILFNPGKNVLHFVFLFESRFIILVDILDAKGLENVERVEACREKVSF